MEHSPRHPSTKAFRPLTNREMQLQTELEHIRHKVLQCIQLLRDITDQVDGLRDDDEESPF
jgi:predicted glycosyltransferase